MDESTEVWKDNENMSSSSWFGWSCPFAETVLINLNKGKNAATGGVLLNISQSQNSKENTCARVSFLIKF